MSRRRRRLRRSLPDHLPQRQPLPISDPTAVQHRDDFSVFVVGTYPSIQCFRGTSLRRLPSVNTSTSRNEFPRVVQDDIIAFATEKGTVEVMDVVAGHPVGTLESFGDVGMGEFSSKFRRDDGVGGESTRRRRRARESSDVDFRRNRRGLSGLFVHRQVVLPLRRFRPHLAVKRGILGGPSACPPVLFVACSEYAELWSTWVSGTLKTVKSKKHFFRTGQIPEVPLNQMKHLLWDDITSSLLLMCSLPVTLWSFSAKGRFRRKIPLSLNSCSGLDVDDTGVAYCLGTDAIVLCDPREGEEVSRYSELGFSRLNSSTTDQRIVCPKEPGRQTVVVAKDSSVFLFDRRRMEKHVSSLRILRGKIASVVHCMENLFVGISDREVAVWDSGQCSVLARARTPENSLGVAVQGDVHQERLKALEEEKLIYCLSLELEECVMANIRLGGSNIMVFIAFLELSE